MFDQFRAFSIRQQIVLIASVAGASILIVGLAWFFFLRTSYRPLFTELRPSDAATIVADLERRKIDFRLANGGTTILVPEEMVDATRLGVMSEDLPLKGTVGFELFNKSDLGLTDFAQKINYQRALQGELERTIMTLDGVDTARVHLSLGEDRIFRDDRVPPKASVSVRMQKGLSLATAAAQGIQRLIAAAVPNLDSSDVVILDEKGDVVGAPAHLVSAASAAAPIAEETRAIEEYYEAVVRQALDRSFPGQEITIAVMADIALGKVEVATALPDWNPQTRDFPLHITLSSAAMLDAASQTILRNVVANVTRSSAANNDTVVFGMAEKAAKTKTAAVAAEVNPIGRLPRVLPTPGDEETSAGEWPAMAALLGTMLLLLIGVFVVTRRARGPKRLTDTQRADFATRLRAKLEQEVSHATSR